MIMLLTYSKDSLKIGQYLDNSSIYLGILPKTWRDKSKYHIRRKGETTECPTKKRKVNADYFYILYLKIKSIKGKDHDNANYFKKTENF